MASSPTDLHHAVEQGHALLGQHGAMQADIAKTFAERNARAAASGSTTRMFFGSAKDVAAQRAAANAAASQASHTATAALPKGISGGRVAAIVAGVALAGGALYALTRKSEPKPELGAWTGRVAAERSGQQMGISPTR